MSQKKK